MKIKHDRVHTEHDEPEDFDVYYNAYGSNMKNMKTPLALTNNLSQNPSEKKLRKTTNRSLEQFSRVRDYNHFERVKSK